MQYIPDAVNAGPAIGENLLSPIEISIQTPPTDSPRRIETVEEKNVKPVVHPLPAEFTNKAENENGGFVESSKNVSTSFNGSILRDPLNFSLSMNLEGSKDSYRNKLIENNTKTLAEESNKGLSNSEASDAKERDPIPDFGSFMQTITASMNKLYSDVKTLLPDERWSLDNSTKSSRNDSVFDTAENSSSSKEPTHTLIQDDVLDSKAKQNHNRNEKSQEQLKTLSQSENIVLSNEHILARFLSSPQNALQVPGIGLGKNETGKEELGAFIVIPVNHGNLNQRSRIIKKSIFKRKHSKSRD